MKRLFFLFILIFVGFGAFGQLDSLLFKYTDSLQLNPSKSLRIYDDYQPRFRLLEETVVIKPIDSLLLKYIDSLRLEQLTSLQIDEYPRFKLVEEKVIVNPFDNLLFKYTNSSDNILTKKEEDWRYSQSLNDTIPPSSKKEKKPPPDNRLVEVLTFSLKLQNTTLQDDKVGAVLYSGYGGGFSMQYEYFDKFYLSAALDFDFSASLPPADSQQKEIFGNLNFLDNAYYDRIRLGPFIAAYRIKNSRHYLGLSLEGQVQRSYYSTFEYPFENIIGYVGLSYVYLGKIWKIPFDINANFPMLITPVVVKTPSRDFTDYFNPSVKIDFAPFSSLWDRVDIEFSYAFEYLNYHRDRDIRHRYRQVLNSFSIAMRFKLERENTSQYYQPYYYNYGY